MKKARGRFVKVLQSLSHAVASPSKRVVDKALAAVNEEPVHVQTELPNFLGVVLKTASAMRQLTDSVQDLTQALETKEMRIIFNNLPGALKGARKYKLKVRRKAAYDSSRCSGLQNWHKAVKLARLECAMGGKFSVPKRGSAVHFVATQYLQAIEADVPFTLNDEARASNVARLNAFLEAHEQKVLGRQVMSE